MGENRTLTIYDLTTPITKKVEERILKLLVKNQLPKASSGVQMEPIISQVQHTKHGKPQLVCV